MFMKNIELLPILTIGLRISIDGEGVESRVVVLATCDQGDYGVSPNVVFDAAVIAKVVEKLWTESVKSSKQEAA
ncbi:MAG TPA: hypothetical protein VN731_10230 [Rhodanobacter sp.]|nr:hypothetical protein [Rhodanobacter sp.]